MATADLPEDSKPPGAIRRRCGSVTPPRSEREHSVLFGQGAFFVYDKSRLHRAHTPQPAFLLFSALLHKIETIWQIFHMLHSVPPLVHLVFPPQFLQHRRTPPAVHLSFLQPPFSGIPPPVHFAISCTALGTGLFIACSVGIFTPPRSPAHLLSCVRVTMSVYAAFFVLPCV